MMLAIIGGPPQRFAPYVKLFRDATVRFGHEGLAVGVHSPGFIADSDSGAQEILFPYMKASRDRIGRERGWPPMTRQSFNDEIEHGAMHVGSPDTVAGKIASTVRGLDLQRFDLKYSVGQMPANFLERNVELYGSEVIPRVRHLLDAT